MKRILAYIILITIMLVLTAASLAFCVRGFFSGIFGAGWWELVVGLVIALVEGVFVTTICERRK